MKTFKDYWETRDLITYKTYMTKYKQASILEKQILEKPYNKWNWVNVSYNTKDISLNFLREFYNFIDWKQVSKRSDLTEKFIIEYENKINFHILNFENLPDYFIRRYRHLLDWNRISKVENLSEDFYSEFQNYINWNTISNKYLSEEFLKKFKHKINWSIISKRNDLSKQFLIEFYDKFDYNNLHITSLTYIINYKISIIKIQFWYKNILIKKENKKLKKKLKKS